MSQVVVAYPSSVSRSRGPETSPGRPPLWEERAANWLLLALSPRLPAKKPELVPESLRPFQRFQIERTRAPGALAATFYPAPGEARGAVLLVHPWTPYAQAYFHRRGRIEGLRRAGYHVMTFDLGGIAESGPRPPLFHDTDVEDTLDALAERVPGLPLHVWGVSFGAYFAHLVLSRRDDVAGAFFEDVPSHLLKFSRRMAPWGLPAYLFFENVFRRAYGFLDLRRHAERLGVRAAAYVTGELDRGARSGETRELARRAGAELLVVPEADHLDSIRRAGREIIALALRTFERAEGRAALRRASAAS